MTKVSMRGGIGYRILEEDVSPEGVRTITKAEMTDASFTGVMEPDVASRFAEGASGGPVEVVMYMPAELPWWKDLYWRLRGHLFDHPYPEVVIAHGKAFVDTQIVPDPTSDELLVRGRFYATGEWKVDP